MKPSSFSCLLLLLFVSSSYSFNLQEPPAALNAEQLSTLSDNFLFKLSMSSFHNRKTTPAPLPIPSNISADQLQPVVIVPAFMNSNLYVTLSRAKSHWYCPKDTGGKQDLAWMAVDRLYVPGYFECWASHLTLTYNAQTKTYSSPPGVTISVENYGNSTADILYLDPKNSYSPWWSDMVGGLEAIGYQVGQNLFSAPYDFRLGPDAFAPQFAALQKLIELAYHQNGGKPVVLVSLSMGCPYTNLFFTTFVSQEWKDQYISSFVSYSGVYAGSTIAMATLLNGGNAAGNAQSKSQLDNLIALARSWGSVSWMTPQAEYFNQTLLITTPQRNYTVNEIQDVLLAAGLNTVAEIHSSVSQYVAVRDPGVKVYCYYGVEIPTYDTIVFNETTNLSFTTSPATYTLSGGDGTALTQSLGACADWANVEVIEVPYMCHGCFMYDPTTIAELQQIVTGTYQSERSKAAL